MQTLTTKADFSGVQTYDGTALSPHWIYRRYSILGNAMVAFRGPADVSLTHMVDLEDVKAKAPIASAEMLHFIGEWFIDSFELGILYQHFFMALVYEMLLEKGVAQLRRRGNDIYFQERKLNVSIATRSTVSVLIHVGINIRTEGTPLPTSGLNELKIDPERFAEEVFERFQKDFLVWQKARVKVTPRS